MKKIEEMTEQEILSLKEEDIVRLTNRSLMERGVKVVSCPKAEMPEDVDLADTPCYSVPFLDGYVFTDLQEALEFSRVMKSLKSLRRIEFDWSLLGSKYPYLKPVREKSLLMSSDFDIIHTSAYSFEKYNDVLNSCILVERQRKEIEQEQEAYEKYLKIFHEENRIIQDQVYKVRVKYKYLERLVEQFADLYYPSSGENEAKALDLMYRAYLLTDEEKEYVLSNYKEHLTRKDE